jgi:hypothetical protein
MSDLRSSMRAPEKTHPDNNEADDLLALIEREQLVVDPIVGSVNGVIGWDIISETWQVNAPTLREALRLAAERVRA